jgi:hypothetical protein
VVVTELLGSTASEEEGGEKGKEETGKGGVAVVRASNIDVDVHLVVLCMHLPLSWIQLHHLFLLHLHPISHPFPGPLLALALPSRELVACDPRRANLPSRSFREPVGIRLSEGTNELCCCCCDRGREDGLDGKGREVVIDSTGEAEDEEYEANGSAGIDAK